MTRGVGGGLRLCSACGKGICAFIYVYVDRFFAKKMCKHSRGGFISISNFKLF